MSLRINILAGWAAHVVTMLIGFLMMPYILGTVGEAQYGAWVFINAVAAYSGLIYAGFGSTICRYVSDLSARQEWGRMNQFVSTIQTVYFASAAIAILITCGSAWLVGSFMTWESVSIQEVQISILIVGVTIGMGMVGSVYGGVLIGIQRLDLQRGLEVGMGILRLVLTLVCLREQYGLITLGLIFMVTTLVEHSLAAVIVYQLIPSLSIAPWHTRRDVLKECFGFSAFNGIGLIAEYLIFVTDTVVIGIFLGPLAVVPYQIGLRIAQMIQIPIAQIGEAIMPKASQLHAQQREGELESIVSKGMGIAFLLTCGIFIGSAYFGDLLIQTWIGKAYPVSVAVMVVLIGSRLIALPMGITRKALLGAGLVRLPAFIDISEAICNLILSLILIQFWGILGVAYGTLIPIVGFELFVFLPYAMKELKLNPRVLFRTCCSLQVPALLGLLCYCELVSRCPLQPGWIPLLLITAGGGGILFSIRAAIYLLDRRGPPISVIRAEATVL